MEQRHPLPRGSSSRGERGDQTAPAAARGARGARLTNGARPSPASIVRQARCRPPRRGAPSTGRSSSPLAPRSACPRCAERKTGPEKAGSATAAGIQHRWGRACCPRRSSEALRRRFLTQHALTHPAAPPGAPRPGNGKERRGRGDRGRAAAHRHQRRRRLCAHRAHLPGAARPGEFPLAAAPGVCGYGTPNPGLSVGGQRRAGGGGAWAPGDRQSRLRGHAHGSRYAGP